VGLKSPYQRSDEYHLIGLSAQFSINLKSGENAYSINDEEGKSILAPSATQTTPLLEVIRTTYRWFQVFTNPYTATTLLYKVFPSPGIARSVWALPQPNMVADAEHPGTADEREKNGGTDNNADIVEQTCKSIFDLVKGG